jgi:peptide/nickel transport system ATP-binding protein/oligopeptide transport system ATP-binding protein
MMDHVLLEVRDLKVHFRVPAGVLKAVDGVSFSIARGETLGLVGESGSGKSATALATMRLLETPPAQIPSGCILVAGEDVLALPLAQMSRVRGDVISMIFQEPMSSLNPVLRVGKQVAEPLMRHRGLGKREALDGARALFELTGIPAAAETIHRYPHELSGGMRQRVMIAMALACEPKVLIADEPTTALDVTIQSQILELLCELQEKFATAILLITHDLGVIAETANRVAVMYAGRIVELAPVKVIFESPRHPYTAGLLQSLPQILPDRPPRLAEIPGTVPSLTELGLGCAFASRCPRAAARCREAAPELETIGEDHLVSCWRARES